MASPIRLAALSPVNADIMKAGPNHCLALCLCALEQEEAAAGRFLYPTWSTQAPGGIWNNVWGPARIRSQAGVTVFPWQGRLYAFDESSLPFEMDPTTLATYGESRLGVPPEIPVTFAAHSKFDHRTGEWLHFGIQYGRCASLHLTCFAADGSLTRHRVVELPRYVYLTTGLSAAAT